MNEATSLGAVEATTINASTEKSTTQPTNDPKLARAHYLRSPLVMPVVTKHADYSVASIDQSKSASISDNPFSHPLTIPTSSAPKSTIVNKSAFANYYELTPEAGPAPSIANSFSQPAQGPVEAKSPITATTKEPTTTIKIKTIPPAPRIAQNTQPETITPNPVPPTGSQPSIVNQGEPTQKIVADISIKPMTSISLSINAPNGTLPDNKAATVFKDNSTSPHIPWQSDRMWAPWMYYWQASAFCHQPLYFEEPNLERSGHQTCGCLQSALSGAHFFGTIPLLPYKIALDHPCCCQYTLGHSRSGDCNAWEPHDCRFSAKAVAVEGAAVTGLVFLLP
jgi:hypothetical protein